MDFIWFYGIVFYFHICYCYALKLTKSKSVSIKGLLYKALSPFINYKDNYTGSSYPSFTCCLYKTFVYFA